MQEIVEMCSRQNLPVSMWLITGVWCMPVRADYVARWVKALAIDAGEATVWIDTSPARIGRPMPAAFERRLVGHLRRMGCEVCRPRLFAEPASL
jgi:hypothetical protein